MEKIKKIIFLNVNTYFCSFSAVVTYMTREETHIKDDAHSTQCFFPFRVCELYVARTVVF